MPEKEKPTVEQIEQILTDLPDNPSERFQTTMSNAPWQQPAPSHNQRSFDRRIAAAVAALLFAGVLFATPLGSIAQELLSRFFAQQPTNSQTVTLNVQMEATPMANAVVHIAQDLASVQAQVGFTIPTPSNLPQGYVFRDANATAEGGASLYYYNPDDEGIGRNLMLMVEPVGASSQLEIGSEAALEAVTIGAITAEYVRGWWAQAGSTVLAEEGTRQTIEAQLTWDNDAPFQFLVWEQDGLRHLLMFQATSNLGNPEDAATLRAAPGYLDRDDLVAIAASVE